MSKNHRSECIVAVLFQCAVCPSIRNAPSQKTGRDFFHSSRDRAVLGRGRVVFLHFTKKKSNSSSAKTGPWNFCRHAFPVHGQPRHPKSTTTENWRGTFPVIAMAIFFFAFFPPRGTFLPKIQVNSTHAWAVSMPSVLRLLRPWAPSNCLRTHRRHSIYTCFLFSSQKLHLSPVFRKKAPKSQKISKMSI